MRCLRFVTAALCCLFAFFSLSSPSLAQNPQAYPGQTVVVGGTSGSDGGAGTAKSWFIRSTTGFYVDSTTSSGWAVSLSNAGLSIIVPISAAAGSYTVSYCTADIYNSKTDTDTYRGYHATFTILTLPPTRPAAGTPAFTWQGSVAGVNTGNGNKTTTLPIVGWT